MAVRKDLSASAIERVTHRVYQFIRAMHPELADVDRAFAEEWLTPELLALFLTQSPADQEHSVRAARLLLSHGHSSRDLVTAALLHDVGKSAGHFTPWHRTAIVILESWAPRLLGWLAKQKVPFLSPFAVHCAHAQRGALLAREAGASELTAELIRLHHEAALGADEELTMLRWADDHA